MEDEVAKQTFYHHIQKLVQIDFFKIETEHEPSYRSNSNFFVSYFRYSLYSAVSTVNPDCLTPHLTAITTIMLLALKSNEGITVSIELLKIYI